MRGFAREIDRVDRAVARERDQLPVGRPRRFDVVGRRIGEPFQALSVEADDRDLEVSASVRRKGETARVGRPGR